jgi:hypothetical protein
VKINESAFFGFDAAAILSVIDFADASMRHFYMRLDLSAPLPFVVLKFSPGGLESVAQRKAGTTCVP